MVEFGLVPVAQAARVFEQMRDAVDLGRLVAGTDPDPGAERHRLDPEYVQAIDPSRWDLPVALDLWQNRIVLAHWPIFGTAPERSGLLTDAIEKIYSHRHELIGIAV